MHTESLASECQLQNKRALTKIHYALDAAVKADVRASYKFIVGPQPKITPETFGNVLIAPKPILEIKMTYLLVSFKLHIDAKIFRG
jgi:hypothetical protein